MFVRTLIAAAVCFVVLASGRCYADDPPTVAALLTNLRAENSARAATAVRANSADNYIAKYDEAKATGKMLVIGVACDTPPGDWLSARVESLGNYSAGTILVAKGTGTGVNVLNKLPAGATTSQVALAATANPAAAAIPQQYVPTQQVVSGATYYTTPSYYSTGTYYSTPSYYSSGGGGMICGPNGCVPASSYSSGFYGNGAFYGGYGAGCSGGGFSSSGGGLCGAIGSFFGVR